ncbi:hypothetical protein LTR56_018273 [Elasticomyces elasticus]|nr:hypothetical protein LTR56_018273 [Elasticomyces elasticus]KAK3636763.1 hypothetical protein LTR22_018578 [Elasticomyces elasticus]KAK5751832.1 hypothetical protein LTS12_018073 [Elasticomyces elasticus]
MATRRSSRLSGEKLGGNFEEAEQHGRVRFYVDRRAGWEAEHADVKCKFTIFDLIPELRSRIYSYAMTTEKPRTISRWREPVLAMVSKQIRSESLPIFFAECVFYITLRLNYNDYAMLDSLAARNALPTSKPPYSAEESNPVIRRSFDVGKLYFDYYNSSPSMTLARLQKIAFRNVDLKIEGPCVPDQSARFGTTRETLWMIISVPTASRPKPVISWVEPKSPSTYKTAIAILCEKAEARAIEIAASRERFLGFSLQDLQELAKEFRYWPAAMPL